MSVGHKTHYEILGRRGRSWALVEVQSDRKAAVARAESIWSNRLYNGVRVLKESFTQASNEFNTVEIFSRGHNKAVSKHDQTGTISPCLSPKDLYSAEGRRSIWDLLHNTLSDWNLTPTELLHNLDHYDRLYSNGVQLQNAVQRTAVSYEDEKESIQTRMRNLYSVIDTAVNLMRELAPDIPSLETGRLKPVIEALENAPNRKRLLLASLSEYLKPAATLSDKVGRIIVFLSDNRPDWAMEAIDQLLSEFLRHSKILYRLLGDDDEKARFRMIRQLGYLYAGQLNLAGDKEHSPKFSDEVLRLNSFIAAGKLPETSRTLWSRLKNEISAGKPFIVSDLKTHLRVIHEFREAMGSLNITQGNLEEIDELASERMTRLINSHVIGELLVDIKHPCEQIKELLSLETFAVGSSNKRIIANFILPILTRPDNEAYFAGLDGSPFKRMPVLSELQKGVLESKFSEMHKRQISEKLDYFCKLILNSTQILEKIQSLNISEQDKATRLLGFIADGFFTDGECREKAEALAREYMATPGFTEGLIANLPTSEQAVRLMNFKELLDKAGISKVTQG